jgi:lysophospholipase
VAVTSETESFRTRDGLTLQVRCLRPAGPSRGTILWIHGGCEHGGRYGHLTPRLTAAGWTVLLPDHRGHGLSDGVRTDVDSCQRYLDDLVDLQQAYCPDGRAEVWLGHSFGGLLALRLAQTTGVPQALILSSPLLGLLLPVPFWKRVIGRMLCRVAPRTRFKTHINPRNMTRDPQFLERRLSDPLLLRSVTARWFFAMRDALAAVHLDADRIICPVLALQGMLDRTVDPAAVGSYLDRLPTTDKTLWTYPDGVHELFQDADWSAVVDRMLAWLEPRMPRGV